MALVDLSHDFRAGEGTYPGFPQPVVRDLMSFDESKSRYAPGTEFAVTIIEMVANTGTYVDTPAHRYRDGFDLAGLPLESVADLPGIAIDVAGTAIGALAFGDIRGKAVLFRTGWSKHWGTPAYGGGGHPHLTLAAVESLVASGAALVGIDSHNIDDTTGGERVAHSGLLAAGIPIVEHLTNLEALPLKGFRFFAVPPRFAGVATFPVRAFAIVG